LEEKMTKYKNLFLRIYLSGLFLIFGFACKQEVDNSNQVLIQKITSKILNARSTNTLIPSVSKTNVNLSVEDAYAVQVKLSDELSKSYGPIVGYKLGYADSSSLKKNNIPVPAYGPIFKSQIKKSGDSIPASDYRIFAVENEIVFTIAKTIDKNLNTIDELVPFVKSVHIGFDMPEGIFDGPTTIVDFVAGGGGSKYFILSEGLDPAKTDVKDITISVIFSDTSVYKGNSKKVLGNPWFALKDVANDLVKRGYPLKAGDVIFSGKVAPAYKMQADKAGGTYKGVASPFADIHVLVK
jgi:2-keto-4-pentenoate hydratase